MSRVNIIREARKFIGKPYKPFSLNPAQGLGCVGAIFIPAAIAGYRCAEFCRFNKPPVGAQMPRFLPQLQRQMRQIPIARATIGDVLLLTMGAHGQHLALVTSERPKRVLHSWPTPTGGGRVQENVLDSPIHSNNPRLRWSDLVVAAFRFHEPVISKEEHE
ncbi:MAG: hypothetical protein AUG51_07780 [Acidobacteria bacterium 13_1_20CM_3_53_8]|nr:MAG: hypothetical protein AUG51_07780 [Acidobacteria bacterium 13_1_20CM_3_53_8]